MGLHAEALAQLALLDLAAFRERVLTPVMRKAHGYKRAQLAATRALRIMADPTTGWCYVHGALGAAARAGGAPAPELPAVTMTFTELMQAVTPQLAGLLTRCESAEEEGRMEKCDGEGEMAGR